MNTIVGLFIGILVVAALVVAIYGVIVVLPAIEQEKRRRAALIRQQVAESRIDAASFRAMQQMLDVARRAQDPERPF